MAAKTIRCVEINGSRVKFFSETIARNPIRLRQIGFMIQEIEPISEPVKEFPKVAKIIPSSPLEDPFGDEKPPKTKRKTKTKIE
jgi:predicted RNA methylase